MDLPDVIIRKDQIYMPCRKLRAHLNNRRMAVTEVLSLVLERYPGSQIG